MPPKSVSALFALLAVLSLAFDARAQDRISPLPSHLPLATEVCYGRVYDNAHLSRHPKQRVVSFHLDRDFMPDQATEHAPASSEQLKREDGDSGNVNLTAYVRFRDRKGLFSNGLSCRRANGKVQCGIDCDGGGFQLRPTGNSLLLENQGFVVVGGCGASEEELEKTDFVHPGEDDKVFRLDRKPLTECAALRAETRPAWAKLGAPLRARLNRDEAVCFARTYDEAHLARSPKQTVRRIAVLKPAGVKPGPDEAESYSLIFRVELNDGRRVEKKSTCSAETYAFGCVVDDAQDTFYGFYLTRAGDGHMMLRDRKGHLEKLFAVPFGEDDRLFRLAAEQPEACDF